MILLNLISSSCVLDVYKGIHKYLTHLITKEEIQGYECNYSLFIDYAQYVYKKEVMNTNLKKWNYNNYDVLFVQDNSMFIESGQGNVSSLVGAEYLVGQRNNKIEELADKIHSSLDLSGVEDYDNFAPFLKEIENLICEEASLLYDSSILNMIASSQLYIGNNDKIHLLVKNAIYLKAQKYFLEHSEMILGFLIHKLHFLDLLHSRRKTECLLAIDYIATLGQNLKSYVKGNLSPIVFTKNLRDNRVDKILKDHKIKNCVYHCYLLMLNIILGDMEAILLPEYINLEEIKEKQKKYDILN